MLFCQICVIVWGHSYFTSRKDAHAPLLIIVFLSFAQPASAQEQIPELPDYTKLEVEEWHLSKIIYQGKPSYILDEHFEPHGGFIGLYYKPISADEYLSLKKMDYDYVQKNIHILAGKEPLVIFYSLDERPEDFYIYERSRSWYEFYKLWHSTWKLVGQFDPEGRSKNSEGVGLHQFLEERYGLKFSVEE